MSRWTGPNGDIYYTTNSGGIMQIRPVVWRSPRPNTTKPKSFTKPKASPQFTFTFPNTPALN